MRKTSSKLHKLKKRTSEKFKSLKLGDSNPEPEGANSKKEEEKKLKKDEIKSEGNLSYGKMDLRSTSPPLSPESQKKSDRRKSIVSSEDFSFPSSESKHPSKERRWGSLRKGLNREVPTRLRRSSSSDMLNIPPVVTRIRSKSLLKKSKLHSLDFLPKELFNNKMNPRDSWQLIGPNCLLCSYKNTECKVIGYIDSKEHILLMGDGNTSVKVQQFPFPYCFSALENGNVIAHDLRDGSKLPQIWIDNNEAAYWKESPILALVSDEKYLITIRKGGLTTIFDRNSTASVISPLTQLVCSYKRSSQPVQSKHSFLRYPWILLGTHFSFQLWNLQSKQIYFEGELQSRTTSISHLLWSEKDLSMVWVVSSDAILIFDTKISTSFELSPSPLFTSKPTQIVPVEVPVTAIAQNEKFIVYGDKVGNLMIRDWRGALLGVLIEVENKESEISDFSNSIRSILLVDFFHTNSCFVFTGHENKIIQVWKWDESLKQGELLDMFPTTGPVTQIVFEDPNIIATIGNQTSPTILNWLPKIII